MTGTRASHRFHAILPMAVAFLCAPPLAGSAWPADPAVAPAVAIIEQTTKAVTQVQVMDLLRVGQQLKLDPGDGIILSYLNSCQRENIRGGLVTIGATQSTIENGQVARSAVACDATALALSPEQASQSAVAAFRADSAPPDDEIALQALFVMEVRRPVVIVIDASEITITDLRDASVSWRTPVIAGVADLTNERAPLERGGVYRLSAAGRSVVFRITRDAIDAPAPILRRLIRF